MKTVTSSNTRYERYVDISTHLALTVLKGLMAGDPRHFTVTEDPVPEDAEITCLKLGGAGADVIRIYFLTSEPGEGQLVPMLTTIYQGD